MKPVFVGLRPNVESDNGVALPFKPNSTGLRLVEWMGCTEEEFRRAFVRVNVCPFADGFGYLNQPAIENMYMQESAENLVPLLRDREVIMLGPAVAAAFRIKRKSYRFCHFFDHPTEHMLVCVIPHPSGKNRLYNNPIVRAEARNVLRYVWNKVKDN